MSSEKNISFFTQTLKTCSYTTQFSSMWKKFSLQNQFFSFLLKIWDFTKITLIYQYNFNHTLQSQVLYTTKHAKLFLKKHTGGYLAFEETFSLKLEKLFLILYIFRLHIKWAFSAQIWPFSTNFSTKMAILAQILLQKSRKN